MVKTFFNFFICESIGDAIVLLKCLEDFRYKDLNDHMQLHSHIEPSHSLRQIDASGWLSLVLWR